MLAAVSCALALRAAGEAHAYSQHWGVPQYFATPGGLDAPEQVLMGSQPSVTYYPAAQAQTYQPPLQTYNHFSQHQPPQMQMAPLMVSQPHQMSPQASQSDPVYYYQPMPPTLALDSQQLQATQSEQFLLEISDTYDILLPALPAVEFDPIPRASHLSTDVDVILSQQQAKFEGIAASYMNALQKKFSKTKDILLSQENEILQDIADHIDLKVSTQQDLIELEFDVEAETLESNFAARRKKVEMEMAQRNTVQERQSEQQFHALLARIQRSKEEQLEAARQAERIELEKFRAAADLIQAYTAMSEIDANAIEAEAVEKRQRTEAQFEDEFRQICGNEM